MHIMYFLFIQMKRGDGETSSHRVPLEIKTGKMYRKQGSLEHRAQVPYYVYIQPLVLVAFVLACFSQCCSSQ